MEIQVDKYKIAPIKAKAGLEKGADKKEQRVPQDKKLYPAKDVDNEKVFEIRMKRIIDMLDDGDPRKQQHKKVLDEHKEMLKRGAIKQNVLQTKDKTPVNKEDEIAENHPDLTDPETKIDEKGPNVGTGKQIKAASKQEIKKAADELCNSIDETIVEIVQNLPNPDEDYGKEAREIIEIVIPKLKKQYGIEGTISAQQIKDAIRKELSGIEEADLTKAEKNIMRILNDPKVTAEDEEKEEKEPKDKKEPKEKEDKEPKEKKEKKEPTMDVFDISEGLPLGNGVMAHKDEDTKEIYVLDKEGNELVRTVNAFVNDMGLVIEFYRDLLGLEEEKPEKKVESAEVALPKKVHKEGEEEEIPELKEGEEEEEVKDELVPELDEKPEGEVDETDELSKKLDELIQVQKEQTEILKEQSGEGGEGEGEEELPDKSKDQMLDLQYEIEEKRDKVKSAIQFLIDNDRIDVTSEDINANRIKGESIIFAKQRAKEAKIAVLTEKLFGASDDYIEMFIEAQKANNKDEVDSIFDQLFR